MREIKFRAWDKNKNRMIREVWSLCLGELAGGHDSEPEEIMGDDGTRTNYYTLMQYTGLKDKNGKEIYEGDIVTAHKEKSNPFGYSNSKIIWHPDYGGFALSTIDDGREFIEYLGGVENQLEIIGNIYENPELLNN